MSLLVISKGEDVTDHHLVLVVNCVEDWFPEGALPTDDFIEKLCTRYLNVDEREPVDIEHLDTPAVRKIMRHARRARQEMA